MLEPQNNDELPHGLIAGRLMSLIHDSEREDFVQYIVAANLNVVDFELTEQEDKPRTIGVAVWTGTVTVTYKPTGISRTYEVST